MQFSLYACPRCPVRYCSLACYRAPLHAECSELFYKEEVERELKTTRVESAEGRQRMLDMLKRLQAQDEGDGAPPPASPGADAAAGDPAAPAQQGEDVEGWSEEVAEQLAALDLDSAEGAAAAFGLLPPALQAAFLAQLGEGQEAQPTSDSGRRGDGVAAAAAALPPWVPWWDGAPVQRMPAPRGRTLVEELVEDQGTPAADAGPASPPPLPEALRALAQQGMDTERQRALEGLGRLPAARCTALEALLHVKPQPLSALLGRREPSPALVYQALHAAAAYAFVWRLHDGDISTRPAATAVALRAAAPALEGGSCSTAAEACARFFVEARAHPALASDVQQCCIALEDARALCAHPDVLLAALLDAHACVRAARREAKAAAGRGGASQGAALAADGAGALPAVLRPESAQWSAADAQQLRRDLAALERKLYFLVCWCLERAAGDGRGFAAELQAAGDAAGADAASRKREHAAQAEPGWPATEGKGEAALSTLRRQSQQGDNVGDVAPRRPIIEEL